MLIRELTVGKDLRHEVWDSPHTFEAIAAAASKYEDNALSTYQGLLKLEDAPPTTTRPNRAQRRRLYLVCLALGIELSRYGLTSDDRDPDWPGDELITAGLKKELASGLQVVDLREQHSPYPCRVAA